MNKDTCTLEYLAKQIEFGLETGKVNLGRREIKPVKEKCLYCTEETRRDFYVPLIRIQNITHKEKLYKRRYRKGESKLSNTNEDGEEWIG